MSDAIQFAFPGGKFAALHGQMESAGHADHFRLRTALVT
jgi:hypothetical protein